MPFHKGGDMLAKYNDEKGENYIRIPKTTVKYIIGVCCLFIVLIVGTFIHYRQAFNAVSVEKTELETLRKNNEAQALQIEQLGKATVKLQNDMERLNSLDVELRRIVNNEDTTTTSRAGLMRPSVKYIAQGAQKIELDIKDMNNVIYNLQMAVKAREESLVELKQELLMKQARLASKPSIWPTAGEVTSRFGWRNSPTGGGSDFHPGIDIATDIGTPIVATADGVVVQSEWAGGYGNMVQVDHGNGIATLYGHTSQMLVHSGQIVKKGQVIAYSGNTGYSTGPHVHYEVRVNDTAVNPTSFLN